MKIAYFPTHTAQNSRPVLSAFLDSCSHLGISTVENSLDADAAVIWSVLWNGRMAGNESIYQHFRQQNKPVICIDVGSLYRGTTWKIAVNNITSNGHYGHTENLDHNRPRKLGISLAVQINPLPHIILAAQHRNSLQVKNLPSIEQWINDQLIEVQKHTDRPVIVRSHPRCRLREDLLPKTIRYEEPKKLTNTYDSFDIHFNCHAVINYNSGPGIQSAISGTRPIVDSTSLAWPVSVDMVDIEKPYTIDREQWLVEICHTEYTLEEITKGLWFKRLRHYL